MVDIKSIVSVGSAILLIVTGTALMIYKFKVQSLELEVSQLTDKVTTLQTLIDSRDKEIGLLKDTVDLHNDIALQRHDFDESINQIRQTTRVTIQKELQKSEELRTWGSATVPMSITSLLKGYSTGVNSSNTDTAPNTNRTNKLPNSAGK